MSLLGVGAEGVWFLHANLAPPGFQGEKPIFPPEEFKSTYACGEIKFFLVILGGILRLIIHVIKLPSPLLVHKHLLWGSSGAGDEVWSCDGVM